MLLPMALERWSQVTIYAKTMRCSIGLPHEGGLPHLQNPARRFANTLNRYRQAELMQMTWTAAQKRHL
jgi:hypothetical protein